MFLLGAAPIHVLLISSVIWLCVSVCLGAKPGSQFCSGSLTTMCATVRFGLGLRAVGVICSMSGLLLHRPASHP